MITAEQINEYIDTDHGLISPRIFSSQEIFDLEQEKIFGRAWLYLAHDTQIPNPGDFFSTYMGTDPILVVRQKDRTVRAFLNYCRHRGMRVCRADQGRTPAFTCTYHGWSYDTAGSLVSVPNAEDAYRNELDMGQWGLRQVPRLESYKGLIFGCFDESAPSLDDYLGDMKFHIDGYFDRREGGVEIIGGVTKAKIPANWKIAAEQFAGDSYHAQYTHISAFSILAPEGMEERRKLAEKAQIGSQMMMHAGRQSTMNGHGAGFLVEGSQGYAGTGGDPILDQYEASIRPEIEARLGPGYATMNGLHATVFPNLSWLNPARTLRVWQPKGPNALECWSWIFVDKAAPDNVKEAFRWLTEKQFGPAGLAEQDDAENWGLISGNLASGGPQMHKVALNYTMSLGHETTEAPFPGQITPHLFGEIAQRGFYRRWAEYMTSAEWPTPGTRTDSSSSNGSSTNGSSNGSSSNGTH
jgi:3-phenylpropionate/trans-cinnamate dioxygenase alpha subunit